MPSQKHSKHGFHMQFFHQNARAIQNQVFYQGPSLKTSLRLALNARRTLSLQQLVVSTLGDSLLTIMAIWSLSLCCIWIDKQVPSILPHFSSQIPDQQEVQGKVQVLESVNWEGTYPLITWGRGYVVSPQATVSGGYRQGGCDHTWGVRGSFWWTLRSQRWVLWMPLCQQFAISSADHLSRMYG